MLFRSQQAYQAVNNQITETYWSIGHAIVEYDQHGIARATYGTAVLDNLSRDLTLRYGKGFSRSNLIRFRQFYQAYPIRATLSHELSWSHIVELLKIDDAQERVSISSRRCTAPQYRTEEYVHGLLCQRAKC